MEAARTPTPQDDRPEADPFDLQNFLPYLLNQAAEATSRSFQAVYRDGYGMTRTQWRVLANLGRFGAMTAVEICRRSHLEKTKVSRAVSALERRGWLRRATSPQDRRSEILSLTSEGQAHYRRIGEQALDYDRALRNRLGPDRSEALIGILRGLIATGTGEAPDAED